MSIKEDYYIKQITYSEAMDIVTQHHYLHRRSSCSFAFGLFKHNNDNVVGVITYGKPASNSLCVGICGKEEAENVIELTRLYIFDTTPKNTESYFIGNTIKLINKDIVVSYADSSVGHIGTVYQATNFIYTGLSDRHVQWKIAGSDGKHSRHIFDQYGGLIRQKRYWETRLFVKKDRENTDTYILIATREGKKNYSINLSTK